MSQPSVVCLNSLRNTGVGIVGIRSADVGIASVGRHSREARQRQASLLVIIIYVPLCIYYLWCKVFTFLHRLEPYYPRVWISSPPLLIEDTSLTVYFCSDGYFFYYADYYERTGWIRAAIREANSSTWIYTGIFLSCYDDGCWELYLQNFTNFLVASHTFTSLKPNTLYSLEFLGCFPYIDSCTVGDSYFSYSVSITTRPKGEQWTCTFSLTIIMHYIRVIITPQ